MRKTFLSVLALLGLFAAGHAKALAQDDQLPPPLVVVSIASYDTWMANLDYVGELQGKPYRMLVEGLLRLFTGGEGLVGWEKDKPAGVVVGGIGGGVTFIPVSNLDKFLESLAAFELETKDVGDGVLELSSQGQRAYLKAKDGWVWLGQSPLTLQNLPVDPVKSLRGLNETYDIAARVNFQSFPAPLLDMALASMRQGAEDILQPEPGESDEDFQARKESVLAQIDAVKSSVKDLDELTLGFKIDRNEKKTFLEVEVTFREGSDTAQQFAAARDLRSNFLGFRQPEALFSLGAAGPIQDEEQAQARSMLQQFRARAKAEIRKLDDLKDDAARAQVEQVVDGLLDNFEAVIDHGKLDLGAALVGDGPQDLILGMGVSDGKKAASNLLAGVEMLRDYGVVSAEEAKVVEQGGVRFESYALTLPAEVAEDLNPVFGEDARLIVASGPQGVYVGMGETVVDSLKKAIADSKAASSKAAKPLEATISLTRVLKAVGKGDADNRALALLAKAKLEPGTDTIRIEERFSKNGAAFRIEAEEGVLKLIGAAANNAGGEVHGEIQQ